MRLHLSAVLSVLLASCAASAAPAPAPPPALAQSIDSLLALPPLVPRDLEAGLSLTPHALALDPLGRLWVLDRARGRILRLDGPEGTGRSYSVGGHEGGAASAVADLAASGTFLFLLEPSSSALSLLDLDGHFRERVELADEIARAGQEGFLASRLAVGRSGDLWLAEGRGGRLLHFDRRGRYLDAPLEALAGRERPKRIADLAAAPDDGIVLLDAERGAILHLLANGAPGAADSLQGPLAQPASLAVDTDGNRYILEASGRLRILDPQGLLLWDGAAPGGKPAGPHRSVAAGGGILWRADPAKGTLQRWKVVRAQSEDANR